MKPLKYVVYNVTNTNDRTTTNRSNKLSSWYDGNYFNNPHTGTMTSIFIVYKFRNAQGTPVLARLVEAYYDRQRALRSTQASNDILTPKEKGIGWEYNFQEVDILDVVEEKDGSKSDKVD